MDAYDAIITRTGAAGDALARHFAPSGKRVLLLERGDWLLRDLTLAPACLHEERDPGGRVYASGRYLTVRHGSGHVGTEHRLPDPARQLLGREQS
jgi:choline dehydrogenase-like flavoprotein